MTCQCTPRYYCRFEGVVPESVCAECEARMEREAALDAPEIDERDLAVQAREWLELDHGNG